MKEDVVAANLANLRQSINELKVCIEKRHYKIFCVNGKYGI